MLNEPSDFLGSILSRMLDRYLSNPSVLREIEDWRMSVRLVTDYYDLVLTFNRGITVTREQNAPSTITVSTTFNDLLRVLSGEVSLFRALLSGKMKVSGFARHPVSAFRFYRVMKSLLQEGAN